MQIIIEQLIAELMSTEYKWCLEHKLDEGVIRVHKTYALASKWAILVTLDGNVVKVSDEVTTRFPNCVFNNSPDEFKAAVYFKMTPTSTRWLPFNEETSANIMKGFRKIESGDCDFVSLALARKAGKIAIFRVDDNTIGCTNYPVETIGCTSYPVERGIAFSFPTAKEIIFVPLVPKPADKKRKLDDV